MRRGIPVVVLLLFSTQAFASPKSVAEKFWRATSQKARKVLCTDSLKKAMRTEFVRGFKSLKGVKVETKGNRSVVSAVGHRKWFRIPVKVHLVKKKQWRVSNFLYKVGKNWVDMAKVMSQTHNMRVRQGKNGYIQYSMTILASQTLRGTVRVRLGRDKRQRKGSLSLTVLSKSNEPLKLKKYSFKGLKRSGTSISSTTAYFTLKRTSSKPIRTDIELVYQKENSKLQGVQCWKMPQIKDNSTTVFPPSKAKAYVTTFSRYLYKGTVGTKAVKNYKVTQKRKAGHEFLYFQKSPKAKENKKEYKNVMITGVIKNTSKAKAGKLTFFVDGDDAKFPTITTKQVGKDLFFTVFTNDFFYSPGPFRSWEFKNFKVCYTPKQFNPQNYYIFRFQNLLIP